MRTAAALTVLLLAAAPALAREDAPVPTAPARAAAPPAAAPAPPPEAAQPQQHSGDNPATASEDSEEPDPNAPPPAPSGPSPGDLAYEARIRASVAAAQSYQGPLDGRWVLYAADGRELFTFQIVDPPAGRGPLEAVWRDLRRPPGSGAYGLVGDVQRLGPLLTAAFTTHAASKPRVSVILLNGTGGWRGQMDEAGQSLTVVLRRP